MKVVVVDHITKVSSRFWTVIKTKKEQFTQQILTYYESCILKILCDDLCQGRVLINYTIPIVITTIDLGITREYLNSEDINVII